MKKKVDWMYFRKSCTTCKYAQGYLASTGTDVTETVDATKTRIDTQGALALLTDVEKVVAAKGKKVAVFDLKNDRPGDEILLAHLMGPTGNLRAPTARVGKTLLIGFNEGAYKEVLEGAKG